MQSLNSPKIGAFYMEIIAKKYKNCKAHEKDLSALKEINKRKISEHNDLITSVAKMDKTPLKIFELAVSYIDTKNPPKDNIIYLSKKELFTFFKVSDNDKHTRFREAVQKMQKTAYFEIKEKKGKGNKFKSIIPIPYVEWNDYNDEVIVRFDQAIMPYLIELKGNFTQYTLSDLIELNSKYSVIIYKWLSMQYNQYEYYSHKYGERNVKQLDSYKNPLINIKELRRVTDTLELYERFTKFESYVLKNSLKEINEFTHFNVTYEKIKKGRSINDIKFFITKKKVAKNENYKEQQQDEEYLKGKKEKEEEQKKLFAEAVTSKYTTLLIENALISLLDMQKVEVMADMQRMVYPYYEELEKLKGINGLKKHLSYVSRKQELYSKSKHNVPLYLKKAITGYIESIKIQEKMKEK